MRRLLLMMLLTLFAFNMQAQNVQQEDSQIEFTRGRIGIDYSMPDFSTKRIDGSIIGYHLADMLKFLKSNYKSGSCNSRLLKIVREGNDFIIPPKIKGFKIREISKVGDVITVNTRVTLYKNGEGINQLDIPFIIEKGVPKSQSINSLFVYLSKSIQEL